MNVQHPYYPDFDKFSPEMVGDHSVHLYWNRQREIWQEADRIRTYKNVVYILWLSNDRLKVGFTSNIDKRMTYYRQEARRHGIKYGYWWSCAGFRDRREAQFMERVVLIRFGGMQMHGTREWFRCDSKTYQEIIPIVGEIRNELLEGPPGIADEMAYIGRTDAWVEAGK